MKKSEIPSWGTQKTAGFIKKKQQAIFFRPPLSSAFCFCHRPGGNIPVLRILQLQYSKARPLGGSQNFHRHFPGPHILQGSGRHAEIRIHLCAAQTGVCADRGADSAERHQLTPFYRAAYYLPSILGSSVAVAILWKRMFAVDGLVNKLLGIQFAWLGSTTAALWVIILLAVWQFGSSMLIFLSAMKQIPPELYEAARVDGAGGIYSFFRITLPLLTPTIFLTSSCSSSTALWCLPRGRSSRTGNP